MERAQRGVVIRELATLLQSGTAVGLTDAELLERFANRSGEAAELAFTALVERHGPMVQRVCRRVVGSGHDADDAFQATFLVLVRRARAIRRRESVASWLHGVAFRVASSARAAALRRRQHERKGATMMPSAAGAHAGDDLGSAVQAELARLPEKYRAPVVLCYLEGQSYEAAAQQLRWPIGTVKSRLARARDHLRTRLTRRGLVPSAFAVGVALEADAGASPVAPALLDSTVRAAIGFAAGSSARSGAVSASVAALAEGVLNAMVIARVKSALVMVCCAGMLTTGAVVWGQASSRSDGRFPVDGRSEPDRLREVERKLDRVLRALEGPGQERLERNDALAPPVDEDERRGPNRPLSVDRQTRDASAHRPLDPTRTNAPLTRTRESGDGKFSGAIRGRAEPDRLTAVERRLDALERRLRQLETRIGNAEELAPRVIPDSPSEIQIQRGVEAAPGGGRQSNQQQAPELRPIQGQRSNPQLGGETAPLAK